jgi:hypothetical protein
MSGHESKGAVIASPLRVLAAGLLISQLFFTLFVHQSNLDLLKMLEAVRAAGYFPVPNIHVMVRLPGFLPAFCGGIFFTLTAGAGLCLFSLAAAFLWHRFGSNNPLILLPFMVIWQIWAKNALGTGHPYLLGSLFLLLPPSVFLISLKLKTFFRSQGKNTVLLHFALISLILLLWLPNLNSRVFINIRDQVLLTNPLGREINDFYYTYTLYPAEAFKSLEQKQIRTSRVEADDPRLSRRLEKVLRGADYLPLRPASPVDLLVEQEGDRLRFSHQGEMILDIPYPRFFHSPSAVLARFSRETDNMGFLRTLTFFGLAAASPFLLYVILFTAFETILSLMGMKRRKRCGAGLLCLALSFAAAASLYPYAFTKERAQGQERLQRLIASEEETARIKALKEISAKGLAVQNIENSIFPLAESRHPAVRYWTARALGESGGGAALNVLIDLLSDPHPNVVCAALYSLGRTGHPSARDDVLEILVSEVSWYVQLYAYNALKELGWTQPKPA